MIGFNFLIKLANPLRELKFHPLFDFERKVSAHKAVSLESFYYTGDLVGAKFEWSFPRQVDHHGVRVELILLGVTLSFQFYDVRHSEEFDD